MDLATVASGRVSTRGLNCECVAAAAAAGAGDTAPLTHELLLLHELLPPRIRHLEAWALQILQYSLQLCLLTPPNQFPAQQQTFASVLAPATLTSS